MQISKCLLAGILVLGILSGCTPTSRTSLKVETIPEQPSVTPVVLPTLEPATATRAPITDLIETPTLAVTPTALPNVRCSPLALMLHRSNTKFDAVRFVRDFIAILKQNDIKVVTYRDLSNHPDLTFTEQGKLFIFTIDDIYLRYPMDDSVKEMIALFKDAGYPAVLGVITESDYAYPETVQTLQELTALGWEVASHSDTHRNLVEIQKIAPKSIYPEIKTSLDKLEKALGLRPITLILPEGQMTKGDQQIKRTGVIWVVGINGGNSFDTTAPYYYVGREGPDGTAQETFNAMQKRFAP